MGWTVAEGAQKAFKKRGHVARGTMGDKGDRGEKAPEHVGKTNRSQRGARQSTGRRGCRIVGQAKGRFFLGGGPVVFFLPRLPQGTG